MSRSIFRKLVLKTSHFRTNFVGLVLFAHAKGTKELNLLDFFDYCRVVWKSKKCLGIILMYLILYICKRLTRQHESFCDAKLRLDWRTRIKRLCKELDIKTIYDSSMILREKSYYKPFSNVHFVEFDFLSIDSDVVALS